MMDDFYARTLGWNPYRSRRDQLYCPIYPQYDEYGVLLPFANQHPAVSRNIYECDSEEDPESDDSYAKQAERAAEAKVKAKAEYEKAKAKVDEAKKTLEECEAKLHAATKKLDRLTHRIAPQRYALRFY
jgi:hypothetical protein